MISKAQLKWVKSLQLKKYRQEEQCFVVQGKKGVLELLKSDFHVEFIAATEQTLEKLSSKIRGEISTEVASEKEIEMMGSFESNDSILAVARIKQVTMPVPNADEYFIVLDDIRDPGNLGTIIRTADWFGIRKIVASEQTTDLYNPKVISSTMGSFCRVEVCYTNLVFYLSDCQVPVFGTFLTGSNIHEERFPKGGLIVIGNESKGISPDVEQLVRHRISIPGSGKAESLNAAIATGIILDNIYRSK